MIYLDNAATTPPYKQIFDTPWMNPSSTLYSAESRNLIESCRSQIAETIGASSPEQIIFTSGSTEAANTIIRSRSWGAIITTEVEHPCVYQSSLMSGCPVFRLKVDSNGRLDLNKLSYYLDFLYNGDVLVAIMGANNETGTIFPIDKIAEIVSKHRCAYFFCDTTQLWVHEPINISGIDYACMSAHKFGGPKGVGFMYVAPNAPYRPLLYGGHQENNMRAGTENIDGIYAMTEALKITEGQKERNHERATAIRKQILSYSEYKVNGGFEVVPNIVSLTLPDCDAQKMVFALAMDEIYISAGSACSTGSSTPSRVLLAMGLSEDEASRTIRISFNSDFDVDYLFKRIAYYRKVLSNNEVR